MKFYKKKNPVSDVLKESIKNEKMNSLSGDHSDTTENQNPGNPDILIKEDRYKNGISVTEQPDRTQGQDGNSNRLQQTVQAHKIPNQWMMIETKSGKMNQDQRLK